MEIDGYFQDTFHVEPSLTLGLGLRWENHPAILVHNGVFNTFDYKNDAQVLQVSPSELVGRGYPTQAIITNLENLGAKFETPQEAGFPSTLLNNYPWNFLPRLGAAYLPFGYRTGTVIRGGVWSVCLSDTDPQLYEGTGAEHPAGRRLQSEL